METMIPQTTTAGVVCSTPSSLSWFGAPPHFPFPSSCPQHPVIPLSIARPNGRPLCSWFLQLLQVVYSHLKSWNRNHRWESLAFIFLSSLHGTFSRPSTKLQIPGLHFSLQLNSISLSVLPHFHYTFMCWRIFGVFPFPSSNECRSNEHGMAWSYGQFIFVSWGLSLPISQVAGQVCVPTNSEWGLPLPHAPSRIYCQLFCSSSPFCDEMRSQFAFA